MNIYIYFFFIILFNHLKNDYSNVLLVWGDSCTGNNGLISQWKSIPALINLFRLLFQFLFKIAQSPWYKTNTKKLKIFLFPFWKVGNMMRLQFDNWLIFLCDSGKVLRSFTFVIYIYIFLSTDFFSYELMIAVFFRLT